MKNRTILVTGGSGFIGKNLVEKALMLGSSVIVYDNNSRGSFDKFSKTYKKLSLIEGDIRDKKKLSKCFKNKVDIVIHLAFINGTDSFYKKPEEVLDVGIVGILNIIDLVKKNCIRKFLLASSSEIYNEPKKIPTDENIPAIIPDMYNERFSYSGSKIISELVTINYLRNSKTKYTIFRPHNIFGEDMGLGHVIPQIVYKIFKASDFFTKKKCTITIQGTGNETRAFCYINDAVDQIIYLFKDFQNNIFNVGQTKEISISEIVYQIAKILKIEVKLKKSKILKGSTKRRCPNLNKLKKFGFKLNNSYNYGISKTVIWYKNYFLNNRH